MSNCLLPNKYVPLYSIAVRSFQIIAIFLLLGSCKILVPDRMFRKGNFEQFVAEKDKIEDYSIRPGDVIRLQLYTQDGFPILDALRIDGRGGGGQSVQLGQLIPFLVAQNGYVDLPIPWRNLCSGHERSRA